MPFCGLIRRKRVQKSKAGEKVDYSNEKPKLPAQASHPTFQAHQPQQLGPRPVADRRNSNLSQASTLNTPCTPPPVYLSRPHSPQHDPPLLPLMKQLSPFSDIPEIAVSGRPSSRPGSSTTSTTYQNSLVPIADTPSPSLRQRLAARSESFNASSRRSTLRPSTASIIESIMINNASPQVSLDPPSSAFRPQLPNSSTDSLDRLSPAPPIPRVSSKRVRPMSVPVQAQGAPPIRRQSYHNIARKPLSRPPSIPPLPTFAGLGSLRLPPSQAPCGVHRSDTVASRYDDELIEEEDDGEWVPPVPGLNINAYASLVGESPYDFDEEETTPVPRQASVVRSRSYKRGCASSRTKGMSLDVVDQISGAGFGTDSQRSKEREYEDEFAVPSDARQRQIGSLTDVPVIRVVSIGESSASASAGRASAEERWSLREQQGGNLMGMPTPVVQKRMSAPAPLRIKRSNGLIVDVPVLKEAPQPPSRQERQERGRIVSNAVGRWQ